MEEVLTAIRKERTRQDKLWGELNRTYTHERWLAVLTEEVGEVARDVLEGKPTLREELVQVAAVAVAFIESLDEEEVQ